VTLEWTGPLVALAAAALPVQAHSFYLGIGKSGGELQRFDTLIDLRATEAAWLLRRARATLKRFRKWAHQLWNRSKLTEMA